MAKTKKGKETELLPASKQIIALLVKAGLTNPRAAKVLVEFRQIVESAFGRKYRLKEYQRRVGARYILHVLGVSHELLKLYADELLRDWKLTQIQAKTPDPATQPDPAPKHKKKPKE